MFQNLVFNSTFFSTSMATLAHKNRQILTIICAMAGMNSAATKNGNPTSILITALPRGGKAPAAVAATSSNDANGKPTFVICEVCDGYLKDLDQLRNHMSFIHKVGLVDFY